MSVAKLQTDGEPLRILQVANVGEIVGGTAACAWTIARALPTCRHHVAFLSSISTATRKAFAHCRVSQWERVTPSLIESCDPDVIILHNTPHAKCDAPLGVPTIRYVHSAGPPGAEDARWYCSRWLAEFCGDAEGTVLLQGVPRPVRRDDAPRRELRAHLVIGRICTPLYRKWPRELIPCYRRWSELFPNVDWEFVGCPSALQSSLAEACRGRAKFLDATWEQRSRLWHWDALLYHHPTLAESFGRTVAEAMRAGCVPIVDARGGFREQIVPETGYFCKTFDEFSDALRWMWDPHERRRRAENCREHADRAFSLTRFGHDLRMLLHDVAERLVLRSPQIETQKINRHKKTQKTQ